MSLKHIVFFFLMIGPSLAGASTPLILSSPCLSVGTPNRIFANAAAAPGGNGSYSTPYATLASVENRLQSDSSVQTVCLTGAFNESLSLSYVASNSLNVVGYGGGANLMTGESYAISSYYSVLDTLNISHVHLEGFTYAGINISDIDTVTLHDITVDASGASYGIMLEEHDQVTIENLVVENSSYAALTADAVQDFSIHESFLSNIGNYALMLEGDTMEISDTEIEGYGYSGIDVEGESVTLTRSILRGRGSYHGLVLRSTTSGVITNNFILDHETAGIDVGESENTVSLYNNSFSNNGEAVRLNGGGPHTLTVSSYNNIFYSNEDQQAYDDNGLVADPDPCPPEACLSVSESLTDNPDMTLASDYNLFYGVVTSVNGSEILFSDWTGSVYDSHGLEADPLFVSTSDLHIQSSSPAIDAGKKITSVNQDIDHQARFPYYFDIGADETTNRGRILPNLIISSREALFLLSLPSKGTDESHR